MRETRQPILFQCAPNFSAGRDLATVRAIASAIARTPGAALADYSADPDHNRCVMSLLGDADAIYNAVLAAAHVAIAHIDLRKHQGVHPRAGAIDVVPVVPLRGAGRAEAVALAHDIGRDMAAAFDLPVYFYEWAAQPNKRTLLPDLRRGGWEGLRDKNLTGLYAPDIGPARAHPSAGVAIVGARAPLVAYNINLNTTDVEIGQTIARRIRAEREGRPELAGVRALGLSLPTQGRVQVSLNLTQPDNTSLPDVFGFVREAANSFGVADMESEIIGLVPAACLRGMPPSAIAWNAYRQEQILDFWLDRL